MQIICFHNPNENNGYLSNWYPSEFKINNVKYSSMEQFMMHKKALCFDDKDIATQILLTENASRIKELGRMVAGYDDNYWGGIRQIVVYEGLLAKFTQNENLRNLLINTGNAVLAECAVKDRIWGIGLSMEDPDRYNMNKWRGQNLLGYTLMMIRDKL